jgi:hypothetical protein
LDFGLGISDFGYDMQLWEPPLRLRLFSLCEGYGGPAIALADLIRRRRAGGEIPGMGNRGLGIEFTIDDLRHWAEGDWGFRTEAGRRNPAAIQFSENFTDPVTSAFLEPRISRMTRIGSHVQGMYSTADYADYADVYSKPDSSFNNP